MRQKLAFVIALALFWTAVGNTISAQASKKVGQRKTRLKWVELDGRYKIRVPEGFTLGRVSDKISSVPAFYFNANPPDHTSVQVLLFPMSRMYSDPNTRKPHIEMDSATLTRYFETSGAVNVYYGWSVDDTTHECTMNSPCPVTVPRHLRYGTLYVFAAFDNAHSTIVEFRGDHFGDTPNVKTLKGDGKLLRNVIVPSLSAIK